MEVDVSIENSVIFKCSNVLLEYFAPTTSRKFIFEKVIWGDIIPNSLYGREIKVSIYVNTRKKEEINLYEFKIYVLNHPGLNGDGWWVSGLVINEYNEEYRQGVVDVFNFWENKRDFNWVDLPVNSTLKADYIFACLIYSGVSSEIIEQDSYVFDIGLIKEERDFFYMAGKQFVGERGYFGHDFHAFKDCLLSVYHQSGYFYNKKIIFYNAINISDNALLTFYNEVKDVFLRFKFIVEEK